MSFRYDSSLFISQLGVLQMINEEILFQLEQCMFNFQSEVDEMYAYQPLNDSCWTWNNKKSRGIKTQWSEVGR